MIFNGKKINDDNREMYNQYFRYLLNLIETTDVEIKLMSEFVDGIENINTDNIQFINYIKFLVIELLSGNSAKYNKINIDNKLLSLSMNIEVDSYLTFTRKSIINDLL